MWTLCRLCLSDVKSGCQDVSLERELLLALLQTLRQAVGAFPSASPVPTLPAETCRSFLCSKAGGGGSSGLAVVLHDLACKSFAPSDPHELSHSRDAEDSGGSATATRERPGEVRREEGPATAAEPYNDEDDTAELRRKAITTSWALLGPLMEELGSETK